MTNPKEEDSGPNEWAQNLVEGRIQRIAVSTDTGGAMEMIPQFEDAPIPTTFPGTCTRSVRTQGGEKLFLRDWYFPRGHPLFPNGMIVHEEPWPAADRPGKAHCIGLRTMHGIWIRNSLSRPESAGHAWKLPPERLMIEFPA